jgi:hypothetical protein
MTAISTALLMVGPSGVGPFRSPDWRVSWVSQLVEAGSNGPYWLTNAPGKSEQFLPINSLDPWEVARSTVLLLAQNIDDPNVQALMRETENLIEGPDGESRIAPYWDGSDSDFDFYASRLAPLCRLGVVRLADLTLFNEDVFAHLLRWNFALVPFESVGSGLVR